MSFAPVRLDGGGCCQVHALNAAKTILVGGSDTQGFYLTSTSPLGNKWTVQNTGIGTSNFYRQCAALIWSSTETSPAVLYAATGEHGNAGSGGLLAGTYSATTGNITWALRSAVPQFAGNQVTTDIPNNGWQRTTGRLLYQDSLFLFAGTYKNGILRSSNTGGAGLPGQDDFPTVCQMNGAAFGAAGSWFCTCVVPDASSSTTAWAGFFDSSGNGTGLWKSSNTHAGTPNFAQVGGAGAPTIVEDILALGDYLYVAAANQGIYRYGPLSGSPVWANLNSANVDNTPSNQAGNWWQTVNGYVDGSGNHVIIIGDSNPSTNSKTLMSLTGAPGAGTGSITYANLTGSVQTTTVPTPTGSYTWWLPVAGILARLGSAGYICPFVTVDATSPSAPKVYCAGSGGGYRSIGSLTSWTVADSGMPQFLAHPLAVNPVVAGHLVWGDSDWGMFDDTSPGGENASTLTRDVPPAGGPEGWSCAISEDGNTVYGGTGGKYANNSGEVSSRPRGSPSAWTAMGFGAKTGGKVAIGLAAFNDNSAGGTPVVVAAVWGSGLWRYDGSAWTNRNASIGASGSAGNQIPITYAGGGLVFCFDRKTGIYRSTDYGKTWVLIWNKTSNDFQSGTVAYDITRTGRLWVSAAGNLYQLGGADTGTVAGGGITGSGHAVNPGAAKQAGPVAADKAGNVYLAAQDTGSGSGLLRTGDDGATWLDITGGDGSFGRSNSRPEFLAVGPVEAASGQPRVYCSGSNVVTWGYPSSSAPVTGTSAAFTEKQSSGNTLATAGVLPVWFNQAGGVASTRGTMLSARLETTDGSATVTPADPSWVLDADIAAAAGGSTSRVQIWRYSANVGGIAGPALAQVATSATARAPAGGRYGGWGTAVISGAPQGAAAAGVQAPQVIAGQVVPANPVIFTSSSTGATFKGKLFEYSSGAGTTQYLDQTGTASATASATSLPVTASAANAYTGGLAVVDYAAFWSVQGSGQSWTTPGGWTGDGTVNNLNLNFATYYETGTGAGPISVTGTINPGSGGTMTSWAAAVATYYALAGTPVSVATTSVPAATQNAAYSFTVTGAGGSMPYTWTLTAGSLPTGVTFSGSGVLSGTPTVTGTFNFTVTVTDAAGQAASQALTLTVAGAISVTTSSLPGGTVGEPYTAQLAVSGGTSPYTWAITGGALPPGLSIVPLPAGPLGVPAGTITGVPLLGGTFNFTARVTDLLGAAATANLSITVAAGPLVVLTTALAPGVLGKPYSAQLQATGGTPPYTWSLLSGTLPPGLTLNAGGSVTGTLTASGDYPFIARVTDSS
jgi:hypothetical protein